VKPDDPEMTTTNADRHSPMLTAIVLLRTEPHIAHFTMAAADGFVQFGPGITTGARS